MLLTAPSGNLFGLSQNAGMGWEPQKLLGSEVLILSTHGGLRAPDGTPIALGFHTGHWELGALVAEAAITLKALDAIPFAGACTDPCDGRTQGTTGMLDSLPFRNDAAIVLRRLMRSLPTRMGVIGIATCDKGLPAMMMALASAGPLPTILIPGGVTLLPESGEDAGKVQTIGARYAQKQITLETAAEMGCRACATPGGGCQFLGTAATAQVIGEALGLSLPHTALAPSGAPIWLDAARRSASAILRLHQLKLGTRDILTQASLENAMVAHAAFGGSTNLLLHLPAIAYSAGLKRPVAADWAHINREIPRLVDALPNGPRNFATVQVFLAGGLPEVMLHLRRAGLLNTQVKTVSGETLDSCLDWWENSPRRHELRKNLRARDGIDPDDVIMDPDRARSSGLTPTVCFPVGNLAPEGSVVKSTSIDPSLIDADGVFRHLGPARVFVSEEAAIHAIKNGEIREHDVMVLVCCGPAGRWHGGDLSDHLRSQVAPLRQARGAAHRRPLQRRLHWRLHRAHLPRSAGRRRHRQASGRRSDRDCHRPAEADRLRQPGGKCAGDLRRGRRRTPAGRASFPRRSQAASRASRRHPAMGRPGAGQRRGLGRMRLRRRRHRLPAAVQQWEKVRTLSQAGTGVDWIHSAVACADSCEETSPHE